MKLPRVDQAIESCQRHLDSSKSLGTEIEAYLTRYLLILICATFEEEIKKIIQNRVEQIEDPDVQGFFTYCLSKICRSIKTSEIAGIIGYLGTSYKERFKESLNGTRAEVFYNNIVTNRHFTAHNSGSNITFSELLSFYEEGHIVLDVLEKVIEDGGKKYHTKNEEVQFLKEEITRITKERDEIARDRDKLVSYLEQYRLVKDKIEFA